LKEIGIDPSNQAVFLKCSLIYLLFIVNNFPSSQATVVSVVSASGRVLHTSTHGIETDKLFNIKDRDTIIIAGIIGF
jgi:hypothetical protein